jgi:PAS domain S-box-containing protein
MKPAFSNQPIRYDSHQTESLIKENRLLRREIRVAREASEITASLVVKQFEETESLLRRFQIANTQRKAVLDAASQISIIATDINGVIIVFNTGAENLLGYRAEVIIGKQTPLIFHKQTEIETYGAPLNARTGRKLSGLDVFFEYATLGHSEHREWTYVRKDQTTFSVSMSITALRDPDGAMSGFLCIATDISEKKRSEKALKLSERNYRLLVKNIPNIVFKGYADGSIEFFDDKVEALTGYKRTEFENSNKNWLDLIVPEDRPVARFKFIEALKGDKTYIRDYRLRKKNGDIRWVEAGSQIICDEKGDIEYITGAFLDVTERKRAEAALHESEEKYRSLFTSGPNPIFVLNSNTLAILDANPSAEQTYGYTKNELLDKPFTELGQFDYSNDCVVGQKVRHCKRNGDTFYVNIEACPTSYKSQEAIILGVTDVTEMMEKDAQLIHASKMTSLGEMSTGIAHELNQPLTAIKMGSLVLNAAARKGPLKPEELSTVVTEIGAQVDRASQIINSLRAFGRKPDFDIKPNEKTDINQPIKTALSIIGPQLKLQNIEVKFDLDETLPPVSAHTNRLEQVIFNLITNARDAIIQNSARAPASEKGVIKIRSYSKDDKIAVSVSDNGIGIPTDIRDKLFEPFFTTKEVGKGIGLGLSIIYGIVRDYGGTIDVESDVGKGSVFTYIFPAF